MEIRSVSGIVIDEQGEITLAQLCRYCGVHAELVADMVGEGIVEPRGQQPQDWRFSGSAVARVQRAVRLTQDLGINLPGAALALDLIDELSFYRGRYGRHA